MRTRLLTDRGTARGRRSPLPTPSASPSARVKTTGRHQVSSSAASASCSAGSGVLRQAGPAGLARRHRRLLCPRGRVFMTGRSGTGTSLAADRRARQPSRGHRLAGLKRGRPAGRRIPHAGPGSRSDAGPPQGHQQGDAVRRGMHLEPLEGLRPIRRDRAPGRADRGDSRPCRECDNNPYVKSESERAQIIESATWSSRSSPVRLPTRSTPRVPPTTWSRCSRPSLDVDA